MGFRTGVGVGFVLCVFVFFGRIRTFRVPRPMGLLFLRWFFCFRLFPVTVRMRRFNFSPHGIYGVMLVGMG